MLALMTLNARRIRITRSTRTNRKNASSGTVFAGVVNSTNTGTIVKKSMNAWNVNGYSARLSEA